MRCSVYIVSPSVLSCSNLKLHQTSEVKNIFKQEKMALQLTYNPGLTNNPALSSYDNACGEMEPEKADRKVSANVDYVILMRPKQMSMVAYPRQVSLTYTHSNSKQVKSDPQLNSEGFRGHP